MASLFSDQLSFYHHQDCLVPDSFFGPEDFQAQIEEISPEIDRLANALVKRNSSDVVWSFDVGYQSREMPTDTATADQVHEDRQAPACYSPERDFVVRSRGGTRLRDAVLGTKI